MSLFENTLGKSILSPAICDRCRLRGAAADFIEDPDKPGLFVHKACADNIDPWKLPPRETETVSIPRPRPDVRISGGTPGLQTNEWDPAIITNEDGDIISP